MQTPDILFSLPPPVLDGLTQYGEQLEEVHLRKGRPTELVVRRKAILLPYCATDMDIQIILDRATDYSLYTAEESLKEGFCTTRDGCRIGIAGTIVGQDGIIHGLREISSVNIRIAKQVFGLADCLVETLKREPGSVLIVGAPGCGKTTLLRDVVRQISDRLGQRVGVADVRDELAGCHLGQPTMDVGCRTDILSGGSKEVCVMMLLRTMHPQWIAMDEITDRSDVQALSRCAYCGVHLLATAHAADLEELRKRPVYRAVLWERMFRHLVEMTPDGGYEMREMEAVL